VTPVASENILVWLPSPLGDAVMSTPALRAIRKKFSQASITFLANDSVTHALSPSKFTDRWLSTQGGFFRIVARLRRKKFTRVILFKNSFSSALAAFAAGITHRIGYDRDGRGFFLTDKISPLKTDKGSFAPSPMVDYYLRLCEFIGCETGDRHTELAVDKADIVAVENALPNLFTTAEPVIVLVPGGAFGTSKCWLPDRFAQTADRLIEMYNAKVVISVAPNKFEHKIAAEICAKSKNDLYNLAQTPLTLGQLKALYSKARMVITNDTGPRHIAIALGCRVVTLFGPNDPAWTETGCPNEIEIVGDAECAPCAKPKCFQKEHTCMLSITVDRLTDAIKELMER